MDINLDVALYEIRDGVLYIDETDIYDPYKPAYYKKVYNMKLYTEGDITHITGEVEVMRYFYEWNDPNKIDSSIYETEPVTTEMIEKYIFFGPKVERKKINSGWHCLKKKQKMNTILRKMPIVVRFKNGERKDY